VKSTPVVYHGDISYYDFGEGHPVRGNRFPRYMKLLKSKGLFSDGTLHLVEPGPATDEDLLLVHSAEYISKVKRLAEKNELLEVDTPLSPNILRGVMRIVGASLKAGEIIVNGKASLAQGVGGGLHHSGRDWGEGFCVFNDVAVCAKALIERHALERVMIFDSDAHTGHGTMQIFYDEPRVLYLSSHQDPTNLYPNTGFVDQIGEGAGKGYTVNVPLPVGADDECMRLVLSRVFRPLLDQFKPEVLIRCGGADPHWRDEIGNLGLTYEGLWSIGKAVREASKALGCGVVDLLCSGYAPGREEKVLYSIFAGELGYEPPYVDNKPKNKDATKLLEKTSNIIDVLAAKLSDYWDLNHG
jgi:acetoin utilization protein AcuC